VIIDISSPSLVCTHTYNILINNNNNNKYIKYLKHVNAFIDAEKRMTSILRHVAESFPPARLGTILNSHRVIDIATNTSIVLNCALETGCSLTSYPGQVLYMHG